MNAREMLENYGELRQKADIKARESLLCKRQAQKDSANEAHLRLRLVRLANEQKRLQRQLNSRQKQLEHLLSQLDDETLARVLTLRYLGLLSYEQIGRALGFSPRHIYRLHVKGVEGMQTLLEG